VAAGRVINTHGVCYPKAEVHLFITVFLFFRLFLLGSNFPFFLFSFYFIFLFPLYINFF